MNKLPIGGSAQICKSSHESRDTGSYPPCNHMFDRSICGIDAALFYSSTPFLEKTKLRAASKAVVEHGIGFLTSGILQRYPYKLDAQHGGAGFMVLDTSMGGGTNGILPSKTRSILPLSSMNTSISIAAKTYL